MIAVGEGGSQGPRQEEEGKEGQGCAQGCYVRIYAVQSEGTPGGESKKKIQEERILYLLKCTAARDGIASVFAVVTRERESSPIPRSTTTAVSYVQAQGRISHRIVRYVEEWHILCLIPAGTVYHTSQVCCRRDKREKSNAHLDQE